MGVDDAADLGKFAIEQGVGVEIAGGAQRAFDDFAVEVGDDEIGGLEGGVVDAAGLDDDERLGPVRSTPLALPKVWGARPRRAISWLAWRTCSRRDSRSMVVFSIAGRFSGSVY